MSKPFSQRTFPEKCLITLFTIAVIMVAIQLVNSLTKGALSSAFGLWPRHLRGLLGVIFSPWLHLSWSHLFSNLPPLLIMSAVLMLRSYSGYIQGSIFIMIVANLAVWLLGRNANHVGASGWVFGLWAWLLSRAYFQHSLMNFAVAAVVLFYYGGLVWGFLPKENISFEGHIAGAAAGVLFAFLYEKKH